MARGKAAGQAEAGAAPAATLEAASEVPAGAMPVIAPAGVTAVGGGVYADGRWYVSPEVAETLIRMHGFTRG